MKLGYVSNEVILRVLSFSLNHDRFEISELKVFESPDEEPREIMMTLMSFMEDDDALA